MKKILFLIFLSILFSSCHLRNLTGNGEITDKKTFKAQRINSSGYGPDEVVNAYLVKETEHLAIYVENKYSISDYSLTRIWQDFENYYKDMINIYGEHTDMDGNSKIILVLMKLNQTTSSDVSTVLGYFRPSDLIYGKGNNGEILYMDINKCNLDPNKMVGTILHEFQHLINFNLNKDNIDVWLNEALSESATILFNDNTTLDRMSEFNKLGGYYSFYTWNLPSDWNGGSLGDNTTQKSISSSYPSSSMFMYWLYIKANKNKDIFKDLVRTKYLSSSARIYTIATKYGILSTSWEDLLLKWIIDVDQGVVKKDEQHRAFVNAYKHKVSVLYPSAVLVVAKNEVADLGISDYNIIGTKYKGYHFNVEKPKKNLYSSDLPESQEENRVALVNKDTSLSEPPKGVKINIQ